MSEQGYFGLVSLLPEIFSGWSEYGVIARAIRLGRITLDYENPRSHSRRSSANIDDKPYGGGPGMVMQMQPVVDAIAALESRAPAGSRKILLAPHGRQFDQSGVDELLSTPGCICICGRYEGIDARIEQYPGIEVWSVGNFVLSGGELAAMLLIESLARHLPGVLGDDQSARQDSFIDNHLDYPHYTRPCVYDDCQVPDILTGGNQAAIDLWRNTQALARMWDMRPDLVHNLAPLSEEDWRCMYDHLHSEYKKQ